MNPKFILVFLLGVVTLLRTANGNNAQLRSSVEWSDQQRYVIGSCVDECFAKRHSTRAAIDKCNVNCLRESLGIFAFVENSQVISHVELMCRDSGFLKIKIGSTEEKDANLYVIRVQESAKNSSRSKILMSTTELVTLDGLKPNTRYNITAVTLNARHHCIYTSKQQQFDTLPVDYTPEAISTIVVANYSKSHQNNTLLNAIVSFKPATDRTCYYSILYHSTDDTNGDHLSVHRVEYLFQLPIKSLDFDSEYTVAVQAKNPTHRGHVSELQWFTFHTPACTDWHRGNEYLCAPTEINDIHVAASRLSNGNFQLNVSWTKPSIVPDFYVLKLYDLTPAIDGQPANSGLWNVSGNATSVFIESFEIRGSQYEVFLTAHANNRKTSHNLILLTDSSSIKRPSTTDRVEKIVMIVLIVIFTLVCLVTIFVRLILQRTSRVTCDELCCEYFKDPENVPTDATTTNANHTIVTIHDEMRIAPSQVQLQKVLGEGAFGMVRKGILTRSHASHATEVAVKMLKDHPSAEQIKEFRREIEVMVSVGSHPNVVSIVGYCTEENTIEMMLLTEYCSEGNLLNYLKNEWERMVQRCTEPRTPSIYGYKKPESVFNFNTSFVDEKSLLGGPKGFSNKLYQMAKGDENGNTVFDPPATNSRSKVIENDGSENVVCNDEQKRDYLEELAVTSVRLVDFARQIATGMNFLARNKVVHRDLAARNVLVCSDNIVKISDFGLSRDIYQDNMYRKVGNGKLPIKWLALESLTHQMYTSQSDVWSFGILLNEICTLGASPYPLLSAAELIVQLKQGYRMEKPAGCSQKLYDLMMSCWNAQPLNRPTFYAIQNRLEVVMEEQNASQHSKPLIDLVAIVESSGSE
ncbi:tyrosine-protein kinase receptor torso-like [Toxorhynchites rutilus septentrionalis]|uniref:tyrosine-protein kinase receptor torso-like n=1 Tax=Toxorhynchites rutilus septentrionalis TaxID=329112 RepID=UPI002479D1ED|nr:tyrosine-protein kinase receptor torso-like [Toxorhynchites rutilus septentrionalis]